MALIISEYQSAQTQKSEQCIYIYILKNVCFVRIDFVKIKIKYLGQVVVSTQHQNDQLLKANLLSVIFYYTIHIVFC